MICAQPDDELDKRCQQRGNAAFTWNVPVAVANGTSMSNGNRDEIVMCAKTTAKLSKYSKDFRAGLLVHEMSHTKAVGGNRTSESSLYFPSPSLNTADRCPVVDVLYDKQRLAEAGLNPVNTTAIQTDMITKGCYGDKRARNLALWSPKLAVLNAENYGLYSTQVTRHELAHQPTWKGFMTAIDIWIEDNTLMAACIVGGSILAVFLTVLLVTCCCHHRRVRREAAA